MTYNSLNATMQAWGAIFLAALIVALIFYGAWGALAFIVVMTPIVGALDRYSSSTSNSEKP